MARRTAILINCSKVEAQRIRQQADLEHRTISGYILHVALRAVDFDDRSLSVRPMKKLPAARPRTTLLLRCSLQEGNRIRTAALRRNSTISGYVLTSLTRYWEASQKVERILRTRS
jgi:uncharacterized protein (DUF1778 family)